MTGSPATLTPRQIDQIVRGGLIGLSYKEIANRVGCSPRQAEWYWRMSPVFKPRSLTLNETAQRKRELRAKKAASDIARDREARKTAAREDAERRLIAAAAIADLRNELAMARHEAASAPLYKPGPLDWGVP